MVSAIPGSEILTSTLNMISQSLQIPVIIFLVIFAIFAVLAIGGLISEYTSRKKIIAWYLKGRDIDPISEELRSDITADWFQFSISLQIDARDVEDFNNFLRSEIIERFDYLVFNRYHQRILQ